MADLEDGFRYDPGMADLEYIRVSFFASYEMLMENLLDPAHVPFAHHKYQGDPIVKSLLRILRIGSFSSFLVSLPLSTPIFPHPPDSPTLSLLSSPTTRDPVQEEGSGKKQRTAILFFHCIPRLPGQSRLIWLFMNNIIPPWEEGSGKKQRTAIIFFHCIPRLPGQSRLIWFFMNNIIPPWVPMPPEWFVHLTRMKVPHVLDTDHPLLHLTERRLEEEGGAEGVKSYHTPASADSFERWLEEEGGAVQGIKSYYTPTSADSFVSAYRSWLVRFAGGKARFPAYVNPELPAAKSRREILDRQRFHVRLCPDCQRVQRWSDHLRTALWAASLLLLATTTLFPLPPFIPLPSFLPLPHWHVPQHRGAVIVFLLFTFFPSFPTSSPPFSPPPPPHRQRFHVRLCPDCQRVQRWSDRLRTALWAASLLLLAATALLPIAPPAIRQAAGPMGAVFAAAAAVVCAAAAHWLKGFMERNYVYEDFVHALWYPAKK
ncbi:unnamed protein product [Closterium sp. NIES-65]|nr:unnamed protein product [Closterium sp. NIES-65]